MIHTPSTCYKKSRCEIKMYQTSQKLHFRSFYMFNCILSLKSKTQTVFFSIKYLQSAPWKISFSKNSFLTKYKGYLIWVMDCKICLCFFQRIKLHVLILKTINIFIKYLPKWKKKTFPNYLFKVFLYPESS